MDSDRNNAQRTRPELRVLVLALTANVHRDPKKNRPAKPSDFSPHRLRKPPVENPKPTVGIEVLKQVFVDRRPDGA